MAYSIVVAVATSIVIDNNTCTQRVVPSTTAGTHSAGGMILDKSMPCGGSYSAIDDVSNNTVGAHSARGGYVFGVKVCVFPSPTISYLAQHNTLAGTGVWKCTMYKLNHVPYEDR